jgi:hypothetical protein
MRLSLSLLLLCLLIAPVSIAQDATSTPAYPVIRYGEVVTGRLDNQTPRQAYTFEGLRGEYIDVRVQTTGGNLDVVLTLLDETGKALITLDDASGSGDPFIRQKRIPENGRYTVVVGRFGYSLGSTAGEYELLIERVGVSFASGSALRYGDTVTNSINSGQPAVYYTFQGERGDIITITMRGDTGNLDPKLQIATLNGRVIAENDDLITPDGSTSIDAQIANFIVEDTSTYVIVATRYGEIAGTSGGDFFLTLERANNSGIGISPEVAIRLSPGDVVEDEITNERLQVYYAFQARRDDIITARMNRLPGNSLDTYLSLTNANLEELANNDDIVEGNQNSQIAEFRIPSDGTYYLIAGRFEGAAGTTSGRYRLELIPIGSAFSNIVEGAGRLIYGGSVTATLNGETPALLYAFYGVQGDTITATMNRSSGDLLPALELLDDRQRVLTTNFDAGSANVMIQRYTLPRTGLYYLRASRVADPVTNGEFILALNRRFE